METSKEQLDNLMKIKGEVRGAVFQTDAEYVRIKKGGRGLVLVQEELKKLGHPIDYASIKATEWYPLGLRAISLLTIKKVFDWDDRDIEEMGNAAPKYSFIVRLLMKYFLTFPMSYKQSPAYWKKHYTVGKFKTPGYDLNKKYYIARLEDFKVHPILCVYLGGYFMRIGQFVLKEAKNFKVKETKCMFRGDSGHEFVITYE